nr:hypothetical protein [uncultured Sphaerochaeta sp.]
MKNSKRLVIGILISLILIFLSSCSDLLMQLGEHGDAEVILANGSIAALVIEVTPKDSLIENRVTVARGADVSFSVVVDTSDGESALSYRWFLDGEELTDSDPGVTLEANTLELDTSVLSIGTSALQSVVLKGITPEAMGQKTLSLVITEAPE